MFGIHDFPVFLLAGIVLNLTPGPDTFYILGRSLGQGMSAGMVSVLGVASGLLVHTVLAAVGLSAFLAASVTAFTIIKLAGAVYLVYLGWSMLQGKTHAADAKTGNSMAGLMVIYRQGVLTNILNPKIALFFLAFLPQFISPASTFKVAAFMLLGLCFIATSTVWCLLLAVFAGRIRHYLAPGENMAVYVNRVAGVLIIGLGVYLAIRR
ncbi:MAG: LysE family translocator [Desulfobulbaceae bacterium]|nr:LysE family translocator [Desulfobulbaceae bacterium]